MNSRRIPIFLLAAAVLGFAGCGESDNRTSSGNPSSPSVYKPQDPLDAGVVDRLIAAQAAARSASGEADVQACVNNPDVSVASIVPCLAKAIAGVGVFYQAMAPAYQAAQQSAKGACQKELKTLNEGLNSVNIFYKKFSRDLNTLQARNSTGMDGSSQALDQLAKIPQITELPQVVRECGLPENSLSLPDVS